MAEKTSLVFKDFVGAEVWKHFLRSLCGKFAQCKVCKKSIKVRWRVNQRIACPSQVDP